MTRSVSDGALSGWSAATSTPDSAASVAPSAQAIAGRAARPAAVELQQRTVVDDRAHGGSEPGPGQHDAQAEGHRARPPPS